jgi:hypothetical protein
MNSNEPTTEQTSPDEPSLDEPNTPAPTPARRPRWAVLLLIGGAVLSLAPLLRKLPHEHRIDFRIEDGAKDVTRFEVDWTRIDDDGKAEIVSGSARSFELGQAPEIVNVNVNLPNGSYALDIRVEHADRVDVLARRVTLGEADRITIPLRAERMRP